jgi:hypothetical protein
MAKKAAKKASASKRTRSPKGADHAQVPMHSVVHFVRMLHDKGHAAKFIAAAKKSKAVVSVHPRHMGFVRKFLSDNQLHQGMAANVVNPCPGPPYRCDFRD